jgi:hypothetical protein
MASIQRTQEEAMIVDCTKEYIRLADAAKYFGLSGMAPLTYRLAVCDGGKLKIYKFGDRALFLRRSEMIAYINAMDPKRLKKATPISELRLAA